jgi:hypothetical protein
MRILTRKEFQDDMAKMWSEAVHAEYKAQIEEAVLAEREACAKVCESYTDKSDSDHESHGYTCAIAIRARGKHETK